jgi:hypothetical protein
LAKTKQLPPQCALLRYQGFHADQRHHIAMTPQKQGVANDHQDAFGFKPDI